MKGTLAFAVVLCAVVFFFFRTPEDAPTAEATVTMPRAQLYAQLDTLYTAIERKSGTATTVAGTPPIPVKFTFERRDGEMLDLTAAAGFRTVELKAWMADGPRPGETVLKVKAEPESMLKRTGDADLQASLQTILERSDAQFIQGHRVTALFGEGPNATDADAAN